MELFHHGNKPAPKEQFEEQLRVNLAHQREEGATESDEIDYLRKKRKTLAIKQGEHYTDGRRILIGVIDDIVREYNHPDNSRSGMTVFASEGSKQDMNDPDPDHH